MKREEMEICKTQTQKNNNNKRRILWTDVHQIRKIGWFGFVSHIEMCEFVMYNLCWQDGS